MIEQTEKLYVAGLSHHRTPIELRERMAFSREEGRSISIEVSQRLEQPPPLVLSTCNRIEVYGMTQTTSPAETFIEILANRRSLNPAHLLSGAYQYFNHEMINHLFTVAAGIDSQMVGETEILGQMKEAHRCAKAASKLSPEIDIAFQKGFQAAKWIRTNTGISRGQISIGNVSAELATRIFGSLSHTRVLIIGSGEVADKTAQALISRGCRDLTVTSRQLDRATLLAGKLEAAAFDIGCLPDHLALFDIVIGSTSSPQPILRKEHLKKIPKERTRPLFLVDLAVPRDFDPSLADSDGVFLYNLDDLSRIANENLEVRRNEINLCQDELARKAWHTWLKIYRSQLRGRLNKDGPPRISPTHSLRAG
ncbi:MAG: glutamyl-tRNA reductase [Puniceicoccaceae bacterium]